MEDHNLCVLHMQSMADDDFAPCIARASAAAVLNYFAQNIPAPKRVKLAFIIDIIQEMLMCIIYNYTLNIFHFDSGG